MPERREHEDEFGKVKVLPTDEQRNLTYRAFFPEDDKALSFAVPTVSLADICYLSVGMVVHADEKVAKGAFELSDVVSESQDDLHPKAFVEGKHLSRWIPSMYKWLEWGTERAPALFRRPTFPELYDISEKLLILRVAGKEVRVCYDNRKTCCNHTSIVCVSWHSLAKVRNKSLKKVARYKGETPKRSDLPLREDLEKTSLRFAIKYLLAVMNSKNANGFLQAIRRSNTDLYPDDWKRLLIPDVPLEKQQPIVAMVDQILAAKKENPKADTSALEKQIDEMVYALYNLTPEEIAIVEGKR